MKKIVIEIDDVLYNEILSRKYSKTRLEKAVANGVILPKHHGRIIDESKITAVYYHEEDYYRMVIDGTDAPTIIESEDEQNAGI